MENPFRQNPNVGINSNRMYCLALFFLRALQSVTHPEVYQNAWAFLSWVFFAILPREIFTNQLKRCLHGKIVQSRKDKFR
jgi:hypothetical protein